MKFNLAESTVHSIPKGVHHILTLLFRLYNKEAVIETLLDKSIKSHIKKLSVSSIRMIDFLIHIDY